MGRQLRRVPLDFDWPRHKPWHGFLNHLHIATKCRHCDGTGSSPAGRRLSDQWYGRAHFRPEMRGSTPLTPRTEEVWNFATRNVQRSPEFYGEFSDATVLREATRLASLFNSQWSHHLNEDDVAALLAANRLWDLTRKFVPGEGWVETDPAVRPTAAQVNRWSIGGFSHDSINQHIVVRAELERLGLPVVCSNCEGHGEVWPSEEAKEAAENWTATEPPIGAGYQMWETVSEGSPISPVFDSAEGLADWLANNRDGSIDEGTTAEQWLKFIRGPGWAPSLVGCADKLMSSVAAASLEPLAPNEIPLLPD